MQRRDPSTGATHTAEDSVVKILEPIVKELHDQTASFPRTIVFCPLKWCGFGHELAIRNRTDIQHIVAQFHAPCTDKVGA